MDNSINLQELLGLLRRQFRMILGITLAIAGVAAAITATITPVYTATALLQVDPGNQSLLTPQSGYGDMNSDNARVDGEVELVRSDTVLLTVIDELDLVSDPEFGAELGLVARILSALNLRQPTLPTADAALLQTLGKLSSATSVQRRGLTFLVSVSARSQDPEKAARLANAIASAHIATQLTARVHSMVEARDVLLQQLALAREDVVASEGSIDRYVDTNIDSIVAETGSSELMELSSSLAGLSTLRQQTSVRLAEARTQLDAGNYAALADRLGNEALKNLEAQRRALVGEIERSDTTTAINLREELAAIETDLQRRAEIGVSGLQVQVTQAQEDENRTRTALRTALISSGLSADALTEIYDLQQQAELARQRYDQLVTRSQQLQTEAALQLPSTRLVSEALRPGAPSWPNMRLLLLLSTLAGLGLAVGIAFLYEHFVGGITSEEQLAAATRTRMALAVPYIKPQADQRSLADLTVSAPLSSFAEAIRKIRTAIDHNLSVDPVAESRRAPMIVVTSTAPGEGKTTLALAIARSYALAGRRTLLIDCDLRRPALHQQLGLEPSDGLIRALEDDDPTVSLESALSDDQQTGLLSLIGSRSSIAATDQLITSRNFDRLLAAASRAFDIVILDTPPLGPVVDGIYIAHKADAVVLVCEWAATPQQEITRALLTIEQALTGGAVLVPVLNQQSLSPSDYHRRYRNYYAD
ncbi:MAG: Wzz/FepE/Etk N-terminal domain-containing protein [Candidatus Devosia phytovorans]|uniref:non-specific protein-tyrosine kinase n=1 Tax=Candidatus Devosia phytovorans TaxID=3121372 RepID=A0AAJ6B2N8_9HYPH|nr:Wzz/FepE/Etk N-terminal domain-containing protein [Devosia sp.]WEK05678.1 MAG: Wzz/FepE/Etk N-terminal domain-containing protein [Devosia sp.]